MSNELGTGDAQKEGSLNLPAIPVSANGLDKGGDGLAANVELFSEPEKGGDLGCIVEEEMGKVSISGGSENEGTVGLDSNTNDTTTTTATTIPFNPTNGLANGVNISEADMGDCGTVKTSVVRKSEDGDRVVINHEANVNECIVNGDKLKSDDEEEESDSDSDSDSESEDEESSSSMASSSDDDDDEDESSSDKGERDMEEGEILGSDPDEMVAWDEDDDGDTGFKGPIRSRNELQVLPPVPAVTVTLQPHQEMLPVGVVSSIIGAQVVVEGMEKHSPLNDGSILWITESRSPLGYVDEIFGPVKNPFYIVRYNSDDEVPPEIHPGTLISFVPEFATQVLNDGNLYKKGYDASNENDEEASEEEEFSDDEKEAEYKKMLKEKKRGAATNDERMGSGKKDKRNRKNRSNNRKHHQAVADAQGENGMLPADQRQCSIPATAGSGDQGTHPSTYFQGHGQSNMPPSVPTFPHNNMAAPSAGLWTNGITSQQPQNMGFLNTLQAIGMPYPQQLLPMPSPNAVPLEQLANPTLSSFILPGGQPNFSGGPSFSPWPNVFSQSPLTMSLPGQLAPAHMILGGQVPLNQPLMGQNNNSQPHGAVPGSINGTTNFNQGSHSGSGRTSNHRGGGRFGGRRGRIQRN